MFGTLEYDGDGNLIARLKLYADDRIQPEIARVTVGEQIGLLNEYGQDVSYEELSDDDARSVVSRLAAVLNDAITANTCVKPFVNSSNGHADLLTATRIAVEPGGAGPGLITFRVTV